MKNSNFYNSFIEEALREAEIAFCAGEIPVGALIVNRFNNEIIARAHNLVEQKQNPLLHAEMIAITEACIKLGTKNLSEYDIYVSLEPCSMCAAAISLARLARLFYSASDPKQGAVENGVRFFTSPACFHRPELYMGLSAAPSADLLKSFFKKLRKDR